jgi:general L-amino acid transport system substrate-binding protein
MSVLLAMLLLALALVACGGDSGDSSALQAEVDSLTQQLEDANAALAEAQAAAAEGGGEAAAMPAGESTLQIVRDRGTLKCGGNQAVPGFGYLNPDTNNFEGFDIDFCKAVAAAALGDAEAIEIRPATANERFPILQSGEIDVLIRNTTWTLTRDSEQGADFQPTTFFDGQGMMVRKDSGITDLEGLEGGTICVQSGTTTEKNLADVFRALGVEFEPVVFDNADNTREAYDSGSCDGFTTDKSGLVSQQILMAVPEDHVILDVTMSKEPLGPLTRHGDNNWGDIVMWTVNCTIQAEEFGIDSTNVDSFVGSDDPNIQNLLGDAGDLGAKMGLENDWCYQVIKQVGNYAEIYDRNLGPDTPFNLPRGLNSQYTDGGLLYSPPFR